MIDGRANDARSEGVKKAPRVNWEAKSVETRAGSSTIVETVHAA